MSKITKKELYSKAQDDLKFNGDKAWETIKFTVTLSSAIIAAIVGLIGVVISLTDLTSKIVLLVGLILVAIMLKEIVDFAERNFERECKRMYENMTILMKLENELPPRENKMNNFEKEDYYIPEKWRTERYSDTDDFVNKMLKEDRFYSNMKPLFTNLRRLSYILMAIVIAVLIITIVNYWDSFPLSMSKRHHKWNLPHKSW